MNRQKEPKKLVNFRVTETLAEELKELSYRLDIPQSQIARAALTQKVRELNETLHNKQIREEIAI